MFYFYRCIYHVEKFFRFFDAASPTSECSFLSAVMLTLLVTGSVSPSTLFVVIAFFTMFDLT